MLRLMLGWSMNLFRVRGIQLSVHVSFLLLLAVFGAQGWQDEGWNGMVWSLAMLIAFFTCVVLHELGHSFTAMHFGIGVRRILLLPIGGMAEFDGIPRQPAREFLITIAGPAVNFAIAAVLWLTLPPYHDGILMYSFEGLLYQLFYANLVMGCFNLLPAFPMDGGRILRALLATQASYLGATRTAATIGKILCVIGIGAAVFAPELNLNDSPMWLMAVLFAFIFFVGELEYRMVKRRELEDAHWRAVLARLQSIPPPAEEPPLLSRW